MITKKIELFLDMGQMEFNVALTEFDEYDNPMEGSKLLFVSKDYDSADYVAVIKGQTMGLEIVRIPFEY